MGKITIMGHAEREVSYDQVHIVIEFKANEKTATRASETVINQCEAFLKALKERGVSINQIHLGEDKIGESYRNRDDGTISATRSISMDVAYNMNFMNSLLKLIQKQGSDVEYHTTYRLSEEKKIHEELMQEAIRDSKVKAELMAAALNQKVIGLKSATNSTNRVMDKFLDFMKLNEEHDAYYEEEELCSKELLSPTTTVMEELEAVWIISGDDE